MNTLREILDQHKEWRESGGISGKRAYLKGADLREAYLRRADLREADLKGAYLGGADLRRAYLVGADLRGAYLGGADLRGADLREADLRGAYLGGADLRGADLREADLRGAYLGETGIIAIQGSMHRIICISRDEICVGCERHSLTDWIKTYRSIGKNNDYTHAQIEEYGKWFLVLDEMLPEDEIGGEG